MKPLILAEHYFAWHYGKSFADGYRVWSDILRFVVDFFSVSRLATTFFEPWKRMDEPYPKGFDPAAFFGTLVVNTLLRLVGMAVRAALILGGIFCAALWCALGLLAFVLWIFVPVFLVVAIIAGVHLLTNG